MEETVFFNEGDVLISNSRFVVSGQTYAMNNVTSVKSVSGNETPKGVSTLFGVMLIVSFSTIFSSGWFTAGIIFALAVVLIIATVKKTETVVLNTSGGEVKAMTSIDTEYIKRIISALNDAIIHRG